MFSAMGTEARLRIMQLLLSAHPDGLVVTEIQEELEIPNSTLSHHLDKLKHEGLVQVRRESTFLRYTADTEALQRLLQFLYAECCTRNQAPDARQTLLPERIDIAGIAPQVEGKFMSAFVRAVKPAAKQSCCPLNCCH